MAAKLCAVLAVVGWASLVTPDVRAEVNQFSTPVSWASGNDLHDECLASLRLQMGQTPGAYLAGRCDGYIVGAVEALSATTAQGASILGWRACVPASVTQGQIRDVAIRFLQQSPEKRHMGALGLVAEGLSRAFPCPPQ